MKFITSIVVLLSIVGCTKEVETEETIDCNCDRVQSHTKFNLTNNSWGEYVTINDCSGVQVNGNWNTSWGDVEPINGECL